MSLHDDDDGWIDAVLRFWFDELRPKDWWSAAPSVDARIRAGFASLHATLVANPPAAAALDARGHLAAILVFDQFSRHLFRGSAAAFAADPLARELTLDALDRGLDAGLDDAQRQFVYMPLQHAEDAVIQERSVAALASLRDPRARRSAEEHRDTIARFGRFPARNAALGRASTEAEMAFLAARAARQRRVALRRR